LEQTEKLEQLRALEGGMRIRCLIREYRAEGIDTREDLERFRRRVQEDSGKGLNPVSDDDNAK
jgi:3-deoxy-manno-octulosonate cytidylyltransferase (CMP-KDO synthetase)